MINDFAALIGVTLSDPVIIILTIAYSALAICLCYKTIDFLFGLISSFFKSDRLKF